MMDLRRLSPLAGVLGAILMLGTILLAIQLKPDFVLTDDSLSSLAGSDGDRPIWTATGAPAVAFNLGLIVSGSLVVVFALGLHVLEELDTPLGRIGRGAYPLVGIFLALVGVFPNPIGLLHDLVSHTLFVINPAIMVIIGVSLRRSDRSLGLVTVVLGVTALLPFFIPWPFDGLAIPEVLAMVPSAVFITIFSYRVHKVSDKKGPVQGSRTDRSEE